MNRLKGNIVTCRVCSGDSEVATCVTDTSKGTSKTTYVCEQCHKEYLKRSDIVSDLEAFKLIVPNLYRKYMNNPVKDGLYGKCGAFIFGTVGTGKTTLALKLAKRAIEDGKGTVVRCTASDIAAIKDRNDNSRDKIILYKEADILILDDLGTERNTEFASERIYQVINYRNEWQKTTIITSNSDLNSFDNRVSSRIMEMCVLISLDGEDWRVTNGQKDNQATTNS